MEKIIRQEFDRFSLRWNKYKESIQTTAKSLGHKQVYFVNNFKVEGHAWFLNDVLITFIDKTDGSDSARREEFLIRTLDTLVPNAHNISEIV